MKITFETNGDYDDEFVESAFDSILYYAGIGLQQSSFQAYLGKAKVDSNYELYEGIIELNNSRIAFLDDIKGIIVDGGFEYES